MHPKLNSGERHPVYHMVLPTSALVLYLTCIKPLAIYSLSSLAIFFSFPPFIPVIIPDGLCIVVDEVAEELVLSGISQVGKVPHKDSFELSLIRITVAARNETKIKQITIK